MLLKNSQNKASSMKPEPQTLNIKQAPDESFALERSWCMLLSKQQSKNDNFNGLGRFH